MFLILIIAFISLIALIIIHELGHFLAAKKLGVKVEEFGLGFPPRLWGKKVGETLYSINLIPFGGFVRIYGHEDPVYDDPRSFSSRPFWQKSIIILGGIFTFWIISAILLTIVMIIGSPSSIEDSRTEGIINPKVQIVSILPESPAKEADLKLGDVILKVGDTSVDKVEEVASFSQASKGEEVSLTIKRGQEIFDVSLLVRDSYPENEGPIGISLVRTALIKYPWYLAPWKGIEATYILAVSIIQSWIMVLSNLFSTGGLPPGVEVTGIVGIFQLFTEVGALGVSYFLQFIAVIAVHLALINSLPLPALDGGWFFFMIIEKIKGGPLNQKFVQRSSAVFFFLLVGLMIWVTVRDIIRIF
jgi:regulator of sigma E protease